MSKKIMGTAVVAAFFIQTVLPSFAQSAQPAQSLVIPDCSSAAVNAPAGTQSKGANNSLDSCRYVAEVTDPTDPSIVGPVGGDPNVLPPAVEIGGAILGLAGITLALTLGRGNSP